MADWRKAVCRDPSRATSVAVRNSLRIERSPFAPARAEFESQLQASERGLGHDSADAANHNWCTICVHDPSDNANVACKASIYRKERVPAVAFPKQSICCVSKDVVIPIEQLMMVQFRQLSRVK